MRCLAAAAHFLIRKKLFNSKYPQLLVAKDFAVAEKKLHLAVSRRKYDPGKKAPKKRHTSDVKTAAPKPSTSQDQPQGESVSEQQPQSESITEQQPQGEAATDTQQEPVPSQFSSDDSLPDPFATTTMTFEMKDPRSIPKKPKYSLRPKKKNSTFNPLYLFLFSLYRSRKEKQDPHKKTHILPLKCQVRQNFFDLLFTNIMYSLKNILLFYVNFFFQTKFPLQFITLTKFLFFFTTNQTFD